MAHQQFFNHMHQVNVWASFAAHLPQSAGAAFVGAHLLQDRQKFPSHHRFAAVPLSSATHFSSSAHSRAVGTPVLSNDSSSFFAHSFGPTLKSSPGVIGARRASAAHAFGNGSENLLDALIANSTIGAQLASAESIANLNGLHQNTVASVASSPIITEEEFAPLKEDDVECDSDTTLSQDVKYLNRDVDTTVDPPSIDAFSIAASLLSVPQAHARLPQPRTPTRLPVPPVHHNQSVVQVIPAVEEEPRLTIDSLVLELTQWLRHSPDKRILSELFHDTKFHHSLTYCIDAIKRGFLPSAQSWCVLLHSCSRHGDVAYALCLWHLMLEKKVALDTRMYCEFFDTIAQSMKVDEVRRCIALTPAEEKMDMKHIAKENKLDKEQRILMSEDFYREMLKTNVPVSLKTINLLVKVMSVAGRLQRVVQLQSSLFAAHPQYKPDFTSYHLLFTMYLEASRFPQAITQITQMHTAGLKATKQMYQSILRKLAKPHKKIPSETLQQYGSEILELMKFDGIKPDQMPTPAVNIPVASAKEELSPISQLVYTSAGGRVPQPQQQQSQQQRPRATQQMSM